ncbi:MAG: NAD(P)/FAD-dependent oxidoreductase [Beijerinckiaceae bacterium]
MQTNVLVIGNGMASVRLVETLVRLAPGRFAITIVGAEPQVGYNRVLLSALLSQDIGHDDILLRDRDWYRSNGITLITGDAVTTIDRVQKQASLNSGRHVAFDMCIFATGSQPFRLPIPGMDKAGVITFRDLPDVDVMEGACDARQKVAVIGGGLLGIEAAYGLARRGADVTLVHVMDRLMERQLDFPAAELVKRALERKGVKILLQKQTAEVTGSASATGLTFADGETLQADLIVCAVGIRPNADLASATGLSVNRGIRVDDAMASNIPSFYAIGECAEHRGIAYGLVEPAYAQADVVARRLLGESAQFEGMVLATNLKVSGLPVFSAGAYMESESAQIITLRNRSTGTYRKLVLQNDRLIGCVLVGEVEDGLWYLDLIRREIDVSAVRKLLIHGRIFAEPDLSHATCMPRAA